MSINSQIIFSVLCHFRFLKNSSDDIETIGQLQWRPIAAMGAVWILVFLAVVAGVRWLGKVSFEKNV